MPQKFTGELKFLIILYICTCPPQPSSDHKEFFSVPDVTGVATEMTADICWSVSQRCLRSVTPEHRSESDPDVKKPNKELRGTGTLTSVIWTNQNLPCDSAARARARACLPGKGSSHKVGFEGLRAGDKNSHLTNRQSRDTLGSLTLPLCAVLARTFVLIATFKTHCVQYAQILKKTHPLQEISFNLISTHTKGNLFQINTVSTSHNDYTPIFLIACDWFMRHLQGIESFVFSNELSADSGF